MSQGENQEVWHLLALRLGEACRHFFSPELPNDLPDWTHKVALKLWRDYMPHAKAPADQKNRDAFAIGVITGIFPCSINFNIKSKIHEVMNSGAYSPLLDELNNTKANDLEFIAEFKSGLAELIAEPAEIKSAFADGLKLGAEAQIQLQNDVFGQGGSPRRIILLHLWLHWPEIKKRRARIQEAFFGPQIGGT